MDKRMWMVRSSSGQYFNEFQEKNFVALGWSELGEVQAQLKVPGSNLFGPRTSFTVVR